MALPRGPELGLKPRTTRRGISAAPRPCPRDARRLSGPESRGWFKNAEKLFAFRDRRASLQNLGRLPEVASRRP